MKAARKRVHFPCDSKARIGCILEFQESVAKPRPKVKTFTRHDGVRIEFCESATTIEADSFNRRVWSVWKSKVR